ncbi:MAG: hypothetical protein LC746_07320, partial [Acidobacteria bacterium]|nr:hypothetical protein [Acidobacteriota bacterium]
NHPCSFRGFGYRREWDYGAALDDWAIVVTDGEDALERVLFEEGGDDLLVLFIAGEVLIPNPLLIQFGFPGRLLPLISLRASDGRTLKAEQQN